MSNRKIEILGLKNCDKCRNAEKNLTNLGYDVEFVDVRKNPIGLDQIKELIDMFGNQILNKRSTTFRGLSQSEKEFSVVQLLQKYPTLMKRPVVMSSEKKSVGWNSEINKEWLV